MKRDLFYVLFAACVTVGLSTSCSDDNDGKGETPVVCPVEAGEFTDSNGLQLTYSGEAMLGKKVTFTPDAADPSKATLILSGGDLNLSGLIPVSARAGLQTPGVVPGELTTTLAVVLKTEGDKVTFAGTDEKDGRVIKYDGEAIDGSLKLNLDVTLPSSSLTGASWNLVTPTPVEDVEAGKGDALAPVHFAWATTSEEQYKIGDLVMLAVALPAFDDQRATDLLFGILNKVTFRPDGNIVAEYKDALTDPEWKVSPLNLAMYTVEDGNRIRLFLNPSQIMQAAGAKGRAADISSVLPQLIAQVLPMLSEGVSLQYVATEDGNMSVYLGTDVLIPILKTVAPLFEDEQFNQTIVDFIVSQAGEMGEYVGYLLPYYLKSLPDVIDKTTQVEIGLKLTPSAD